MLTPSRLMEMVMGYSKYKLWIAFYLGIINCAEIEAKNSVVITHESGKCIIDESYNTILGVPQDLKLFESQIDEKDLRSRQKDLNKDFDKQFFLPWSKKYKNISPIPFSGNYFGENLHRLSRKETKYIQDNIKYRSSILKKGIIVKNTLAKLWPTDSQLFEDLKNPGDSYPFDINLHSLMHLGTPVRITAISKDKLWVFASCYAYSGWVSRHDIAYVTDKFIKKYESYQKVVAVKDDIVITCENNFLNKADIGTILVKDEKGLLCPYKNFKGFAHLIHCNASGLEEKPFKFTAKNAIKITEQFLDQKYGWGGYLNSRDCSSLTMDYCTTFGIPLNRNSRSQLFSGDYQSLSKDKASAILNHGKPFHTLVGKKGHVMLYVGKYNNKPVFLHNVWSAPKNPGQMSRYVIGKTVLTTSDFGKDIKETENCKLEDVITVMKFL